VTGSFDTCLGDDAGRNSQGAAADDTLIGQAAGRGYTTSSFTGIADTLVGEGAGGGLSSSHPSPGNQVTAIGAGAGTGIGSWSIAIGDYAGGNVTGFNNTLIGEGVAGTTLTSGDNDILISTGNGGSGDLCDTLSGSTSNVFLVCGSPYFGSGIGGPGWSATGTNAPTTSVSSIAGSLGIGTTTPYSRLTLWGPDTSGGTSALVIANSASTTEFNVLDNGNATLAGTLTQNSDERLKTNIQSLDASSSLAAIDALNPVTFNWLDLSQGSTTQLGFIAQQVQQIFPNLVATTSPTALTPDGTLSLNYIGLISPIVAAIQALSAELTTLENTVAAFADSFVSNRITANNQLCIGSTCIDQQQLAAVLAAANQSGSSQTPPPPSSNGAAASSSTDSSATPPVLQVNGDNPAIIQVGATYTDLGATITGPTADLNLGITTYVNGVLTDPVQVDTSTAATDTIAYVATDSAGLTSTSTRTVIIQAADAPSIIPVADASTTEATTTAQ
jgi:Chaperone of endosialidase/Domain of unknown function (DUF5011)